MLLPNYKKIYTYLYIPKKKMKTAYIVHKQRYKHLNIPTKQQQQNKLHKINKQNQKRKKKSNNNEIVGEMNKQQQTNNKQAEYYHQIIVSRVARAITITTRTTARSHQEVIKKVIL